MNPGYQSPYPRNNALRTPRREVDISAIGEAWGIVSKNLAPFALAALAMLVIQQLPGFIGSGIAQAVTMPMTRSGDPSATLTATFIQMGISLPFSLVGAALGTVIAGSIVLMALKTVRGGTPEIGDIGLGFSTNPLGLLVSGFLVGLGTTIGTYLCLIPGLILGGLWFITTPYMLDKGMGPIEAMSASWNTMKENLVMGAVIYILAALAAFIGVCACGIGILVTLPILMATQAIIYEDLTADDNTGSYGGGSYPTDPFSAYSTPPAPGQDPFAAAPSPEAPQAPSYDAPSYEAPSYEAPAAPDASTAPDSAPEAPSYDPGSVAPPSDPGNDDPGSRPG